MQSCDQNRQAETQPALGELKIITEKRRYIYTLKIITFYYYNNTYNIYITIYYNNIYDNIYNNIYNNKGR